VDGGVVAIGLLEWGNPVDTFDRSPLVLGEVPKILHRLAPIEVNAVAVSQFAARAVSSGSMTAIILVTGALPVLSKRPASGCGGPDSRRVG
jgi:hypothetical protein